MRLSLYQGTVILLVFVCEQSTNGLALKKPDLDHMQETTGLTQAGSSVEADTHANVNAQAWLDTNTSTGADTMTTAKTSARAEGQSEAEKGKLNAMLKGFGNVAKNPMA